jgi:hypothetical protein
MKHALGQHLDNSSAHAVYCEECDRRFYDDRALQQHRRDSPAHNPHCDDCNRAFDSYNAYKQHVHDSSRHKTRSQVYKEQEGFRSLVQSYGLKRKWKQSAIISPSSVDRWQYDHEDVEEANVMADAMISRMHKLSV